MFINKIEKEIKIKNCNFLNVRTSFIMFQILFSYFIIQNTVMENIVSISDYIILIFESNSFANSVNLENSSIGFICLDRNSNISIKNSSFTNNKLILIDNEMSFITIRSDYKSEISIIIENTLFVGMDGSNNGTVKLILNLIKLFRYFTFRMFIMLLLK